MPITLQSALTSNIIISQVLASRFLTNFFIKILGFGDFPQLGATPIIAYYISPLHTIKEAILDSIHTAMYIMFMPFACALFPKTWIEISGSGPRDVSKELKDQQMVMSGHREGLMCKGLKRIIPAVAASGGAILRLLSV